MSANVVKIYNHHDANFAGKPRVVVIPTLLSLAALQVATMATCCAASYIKVGITITPGSKWNTFRKIQ